jgi:hypothetical protein
MVHSDARVADTRRLVAHARKKRRVEADAEAAAAVAACAADVERGRALACRHRPHATVGVEGDTDAEDDGWPFVLPEASAPASEPNSTSFEPLWRYANLANQQQHQQQPQRQLQQQDAHDHCMPGYDESAWPNPAAASQASDWGGGEDSGGDARSQSLYDVNEAGLSQWGGQGANEGTALQPARGHAGLTSSPAVPVPDTRPGPGLAAGCRVLGKRSHGDTGSESVSAWDTAGYDSGMESEG